MKQFYTRTRKAGLRFWLLLFFASNALYAQRSGLVTGRVADEANQPLSGVTVAVKGTTTGSITDAKGEYSVNVPAGSVVLVFSFIGYVTEETPLNGRTTVNVTLLPDLKSLSEVVVVGYGTQRRAEVTGAVASVKSTEILQTPVANVAQGLQARVSGVQITQNSAAPGGNISIRVRGTNSINGSSEPLYVIDGIQISNGGGVNEVSPLSTINPGDIESIEVLKDATATAIYGARGANGVVLITTKRGKAGATRVTFDSYYGVQQVNKKLPTLNAREFAQLENEIYRTGVFGNLDTLGQGVNWQDLIFRQAPIQNYQLGVAGGSEKTQFSLSGNYFGQDGVVIGSDFRRYGLSFNLDHQINQRAKVGTSVLTTYSVNNSVPSGVSSIDAPAFTASILGAALAAPPTLQPYRPDGSVFPFGDQFNERYRELANPLGLAQVLNRTGIRRTLGNLYAEFGIIKGLTYRASFNADIQANLNDQYSPKSIVAARDRALAGAASKTNSNSLALLHESILSYSTTFANDHSLKFTGVFATQSNDFNTNFAGSRIFPNDLTLNEALQLGTQLSVSSFRSRQRLDSYMGRVNYGFRNKLFLDITARADGSSKFGADNKYGFFPAAAAAWRIIEEPFMQSLSAVSDLKLRASYGVTGNADAIGPYQSLALAAPSPVSPTGGSNDYSFNHIYTTGISPTGIPNPGLRWERSAQANIGVDIGLFNNRLNVVVDVYDKKTTDLLFTRNLPLSSGYRLYTDNFASLENRGIEMAVNARIMDNEVKWNFSGNITFNRNKVLALQGGLQEFAVNNYTILRVGQPLGLFRTYVFDGIYQTGENILPGSDSRVGGTKVRDLNGDNQISDADRTITGNANPNFIFGFSTDLRYKNFDFSAFFAGVQGNEIYNLTRYLFENPNGGRNVAQGVVNRWSPTNPNNEYIAGFQGGRLPISDRFMEDGSFLRCKNVTLGYTLPKFKGVSSIRVYVSGNNLFTVTNYTGYDPEVNTFGNSNTLVGVDNLVYPVAKSFLGGLQVTF